VDSDPLGDLFDQLRMYPFGLRFFFTAILRWEWLPSGKRLHNYIWKITMLLMGKSTISMAMFNSYVSHYQRVPFVMGSSPKNQNWVFDPKASPEGWNLHGDPIAIPLWESPQKSENQEFL
jgi:hypothetical protein